jgi:hypothetical protein
MAAVTLKQVVDSRTVRFGAALAIASAVQLFVPFLPAEYVGYAGAAVGAAIIILRFLTTVPLSEK